MAGATQRRFDIGQVLDDGPWAGLQKRVVCLAALAIVLDGFDGQLIGFAVPVLIREWGLTRGDFAPIVAAGLFGMAAGSVLGGMIGDRYGRRIALIFSVFLFGATTSVIGLAPNLWTLGVLRFIAGIGIGGTLPSATTLAAEYTPARARALTVTATIVCFPLGGMLAGFYANAIMPGYGWRGLFLVGGLLPVVFALVLAFTLLESPRFLAHRPQRWPDLIRLLARTGRSLPADAVFSDVKEESSGAAEKAPGFSALLGGTLARDTIALWVSFFCCLFAVYSAFSWLPSMLSGEGFAPSVANAGLTAYNMGGVAGALLCASLIPRIGSRWPMVVCAVGGALSALALKFVPNDQTALLIAGLGLHGLFVNAVNSTLYAVSAFLYPTEIRARGTATALGVGRFGAIFSSFAGAAVLTAGGSSGFLTALGASMLLVAVALLALRRHIAANPVRTGANGAAAASDAASR